MKSLMTDVPDLPNFSRFHDAFRDNPKAASNEGHMRPAFFMAYDEANCEFIKLASEEIDERLKDGPEMVSANFVIPYPPGFPIMVPGQVITADTITYMRKLDVKEIHGYHAAQGLKLIKPSVLAGRKAGSDRMTDLTASPIQEQPPCKRSSSSSLDNPYILLFFTVGMAVWVGKFSVKGYGLGMVAAAVVVGAALATWASTYGVKLQLDNFAKSLFYYLFMYGVGLRVGPAFFNSLKKDGITFTILAVICAFLGLGLVVLMSKLLELPPGAAGGMLAGSQTMSAAIGTAEMAVEQGAYKLPAGTTAEQITAMIALGYGVTYIWGTVGIILICKYLPRWWGIDAKAAAAQVRGRARRQERRRRRHHRLSRRRPARLPAREPPRSPARASTTSARRYPQYRIVNVVRGDETLGAASGDRCCSRAT